MQPIHHIAAHPSPEYVEVLTKLASAASTDCQSLAIMTSSLEQITQQLKDLNAKTTSLQTENADLCQKKTQQHHSC